MVEAEAESPIWSWGSPELRRRATAVRLVGTDIDGVWTDACMYYSAQGELMKGFSTYDGMGVALLRRAGLETVILTSENTPIVARRAEKLQITEVHLGVADKLVLMHEIAAARELSLEQVAYIGDDVNDLPLLQEVGFPVLAANSPILARLPQAWVTRRRGGEGAFRDLAELLLAAPAGKTPSPHPTTTR
jgi:YrbI family 3-deoxy-D-manno-octulosonate 8-phosphate phosphatase